MGNGKMTLPHPLPSPSFWLAHPYGTKFFLSQFSAAVKIRDGSFNVQRQGIWRKISNKELLVHLAR